MDKVQHRVWRRRPLQGPQLWEWQHLPRMCTGRIHEHTKCSDTGNDQNLFSNWRTATIKCCSKNYISIKYSSLSINWSKLYSKFYFFTEVNGINWPQLRCGALSLMFSWPTKLQSAIAIKTSRQMPNIRVLNSHGNGPVAESFGESSYNQWICWFDPTFH